MRKILFIFTSLLCAATLAAQVPASKLSPDEIDRLNSRLKEVAGSISSIESGFMQTKHIDVFDRDITSEGAFLYYMGNKICLDYTNPVAYRIVIADGRLMTLADGRKTIIDLHENAMMNQMQKLIAACMAGRLQDLSHDFNMAFSADDSHYIIDATPLDAGIKNYISAIRLAIDKKNGTVSQLTFHENASDYTTYRFVNQRYNQLNAHDPRFAIQ